MKHNQAIILFLSALTVCTVSHAIAIPTTIGQYDQLVQNVLGADPFVAAEAMASILNDDQAVLATAEPILKDIADAPEEIVIDPLLDLDQLPLWVLPNIFNKVPPKGKRVHVIREWLSHSIREAAPSEQRDKVRLEVLDLYVEHYDHTHDSDLLDYARLLFFWEYQMIIPESDCMELLAFLEHIVEDRKQRGEPLTLDECESVIVMIVDYALYKITEEQRADWVSHYKFIASDPESLAFVERLLYRNYYFSPVPEAEYRSIYGKTPEQLLNLMKDSTSLHNGLDQCIAQLLAGTPKLRQNNFQILLPSIRHGCLGKCGSFFNYFCEPIHKDADPERKKQQDILLDILEEKIKSEKDSAALHMINRMLLDHEEITNSYAYERIKKINEWCAKSKIRELMSATRCFSPE